MFHEQVEMKHPNIFLFNKKTAAQQVCKHNHTHSIWFARNCAIRYAYCYCNIRRERDRADSSACQIAKWTRTVTRHRQQTHKAVTRSSSSAGVIAIFVIASSFNRFDTTSAARLVGQMCAKNCATAKSHNNQIINRKGQANQFKR